MPPMKKAKTETVKTDDTRMYRIITDREPVWDDVRRKRNELIRGKEDDPAIVAMLDRKWIEVVDE